MYYGSCSCGRLYEITEEGYIYCPNCEPEIYNSGNNQEIVFQNLITRIKLDREGRNRRYNLISCLPNTKPILKWFHKKGLK